MLRCRFAAFFLLTFLFAGCPNQVGDESRVDAGPAPPVEEIACEDDDDCPERALCRGGLCADVGAGCVRKSECSGGEVCVDGACGPPPESCSSSEECPGVEQCDGFARTCFGPDADGCAVDDDCSLEPGCAEGCTCEPDGSCEPTGAPGTDAGPPVEGEALSLGGFVLENREHAPPTQVGVLPEGTRLDPGQHLVIARDSSRASFEAFWEVTLGDDVVFLNAQAGTSGVPIVNGDETWALVSPVGSVVDGATIAGQRGRAYRRIDGGAASAADSWSTADADEALPGQSSLPAAGVGLVISQWSDASGDGSFIYEFVELYYAP